MSGTEAQAAVAGVEEVAAAIEALTPEDLRRLRRAATFWVKGLGSAKRGRDEDDILQEAISLTLEEDKRRWKIGTVDFVHHLSMTIKSTANAWRRKSERGDAREQPPEGQPLEEQAESHEPNPERTLRAKDEVEAIEMRFATDPVIPDILAGWGVGMKGPEIMEALGLSDNQYRAAVRKLRRYSKGKANRTGRG